MSNGYVAYFERPVEKLSLPPGVRRLALQRACHRQALSVMSDLVKLETKLLTPTTGPAPLGGRGSVFSGRRPPMGGVWRPPTPEAWVTGHLYLTPLAEAAETLPPVKADHFYYGGRSLLRAEAWYLLWLLRQEQEQVEALYTLFTELAEGGEGVVPFLRLGQLPEAYEAFLQGWRTRGGKPLSWWLPLAVGPYC